jgi:hypothetical protein
MRDSQFFNYKSKLHLINLSAILKVKFQLLYAVIFAMKALVCGSCLSPKFLSSVFYANLGPCLDTVVPGMNRCLCVCVSEITVLFA